MAKSFLFLPDISGFTEFVSHTEITHSQHIIAELLEVLIDANDLDLELAEIEGDALFFYLENQVPTLDALQRQVEHMFLAFHNHLQLYDHQRICECGACQSATQLQLKFFAHAGEIQFVEIRDFKKPHGREVIMVHRLMKNSVPIKEYLLISDDLRLEFNLDTTSEDLAGFSVGRDVYDAGALTYRFHNLGALKGRLNELPQYTGASDSPDPILLTGSIDLPPKKLLELVSNLKYRHLWNTDVDDILYEENRLNRAGQAHLCVINGREVVIETVSRPKESENKYIYGEKTSDFPLMKQFVNYFIIEPNRKGSQLTIEGHLDAKNIFGNLVKPIFKRKLKNTFKRALDNLRSVVEKGEYAV